MTDPATQLSKETPTVQTSLPRKKTSTLAILSLVFGVLGLFSFGSLIAIILGHIGRSEIKKAPELYEGDGIALAGLITGYLGLIMGLLWLVFLGGLGILAVMLS